MSSASSQSLCQAVCCIEFSLFLPWALAGHTSCHPSPTVSPSLPVSVCLFSASLYKTGCSDPPLLATLPSLSVALGHSACAVPVQTGGIAVDKAAGLQKTHQLTWLLRTFRKISAQPKNKDCRPSKTPGGCCTTSPKN